MPKRPNFIVVLAAVVVAVCASTFAQEYSAQGSQAAQQSPQSAPDMSAPYQITWVVPIDSGSVNQMTQLMSLQLKMGRKHFIFLISSQGGEVLAGLAAYNFLHGLNVDITTYNIGQVDSAANLIFCAGNRRYALPDSRFLLHSAFTQIAPGTPLNADILDGQYQQVQNMNRLITDVLNNATKNKHTADIEAAVRGQKILTPPEAKQWGLIDDQRESYFTPNAVLATVNPVAIAPTPAATSSLVSLTGK
jgi:ATP-dependent Clp protease protease subunit